MGSLMLCLYTPLATRLDINSADRTLDQDNVRVPVIQNYLCNGS